MQAPARKAAGALGLFKRPPILALSQNCHRVPAAFILRRVSSASYTTPCRCWSATAYSSGFNLLISQLTSISRGRSTIRHLWTRVIAVSSATHEFFVVSGALQIYVIAFSLLGYFLLFVHRIVCALGFYCCSSIGKSLMRLGRWRYQPTGITV